MERLLDSYRLVLALWAVGIVVGALEFWSVAPAFRPDGVYSWRIFQLRFAAPYALRVRAFGEGGVWLLLATRLLALTLVLLAPLRSAASSAALGLLILTMLAFIWRRGFGDDGSDRMNLVILLAVFVCVGPHSTRFTLQAGLWFIALQACLAYTTAGIAKLRSPSWRNGDGLVRVLATETYGLDPVARLLERRQWLALVLSWTVIVMETLFALCLVVPEPWIWLFVGWGVIFHLLSAAIMGFNTFFWAFVATYPAILYVASVVRDSLRIDDLAAWP